jgi:hypothetical protein
VAARDEVGEGLADLVLVGADQAGGLADGAPAVVCGERFAELGGVVAFACFVDGEAGVVGPEEVDAGVVEDA